MVGTALGAFAHHTATLLRRNLPRGWRRIDEVGGELRVARLGICSRLLLHRAVAADAVGQRENFHRGVVGNRRQEAEYGDDVLLVTRDEVALELAVRAVAEDVQRRAAQEAQFCQRPEYRHHPRAERALLRAAERIEAAAQD